MSYNFDLLEGGEFYPGKRYAMRLNGFTFVRLEFVRRSVYLLIVDLRQITTEDRNGNNDMIIIIVFISNDIINIETTSQETSITLPVKRSDDSLEERESK